MTDQITLTDGRTFRVELNWNAFVTFLESSGRDDVRELVNLASIKPSDLAGLLAAGIHEGERLEGRDIRFTSNEIGALADFQVMTDFIQIFGRQTQPRGGEAEKKG